MSSLQYSQQNSMNDLDLITHMIFSLNYYHVVVTDGYTGNMVLKNLEGTAKSIGKMLKDTIMSSTKNKLAGNNTEPPYSE
jgi:glycerol-3-phosphate acyltransferase PlsX